MTESPRDGRASRHCIVPPHMHEEMLLRGSDAQRRRALSALRYAEAARNQRENVQDVVRSTRNELIAGFERGYVELARRTYDAGGGVLLPGRLVRDEGAAPTGDVAVDEAHDGAEATWKLYYDIYGRNSLDDNGMEIVQTVHYSHDYNNAFWDGHQMVYGDGDGDIFDRFTIDVDIIAHELSHGVTEFESGLVYRFQSGALNEHYSDVFGSLVKQRVMGHDAGTADWLIGEKVLIGDEYALRSMKAPGTAYVDHPAIGTDPQPATMDDYKDWGLERDRGGVHVNSGIPNHAFYLAATAIGGNAWEKAGFIWYTAFTDMLKANATFVRAARATIEAAWKEYGAKSQEARAVEDAWKQVKVI